MNALLSSLIALTVASVTIFSAHAQDVQGNSKADEAKIAMCIGCHGIKGYQASFPEVYRVPMISVGFRHRIGPFDPVIHMEAQLWLAQGEANTIAIRILSAKAGAIPIHPQAILERISESATQNGMDVSWFRHNGCPVAILRFQADRPRPTFLLRSLAIDKGLLVIRGSSVDDDNPAQTSPTP